VIETIVLCLALMYVAYLLRQQRRRERQREEDAIAEAFERYRGD
jgi:preprotein translocase subunit YajC